MARRLEPESFEAAAAALSAAVAGRELVRIVGAGTKQAWGAPGRQTDLELHTRRLDRIFEHNAGDLTAVVEAGVPLSRARSTFAQAGQMLALDPWLGSDEQATIGGILATGDSGPLRHRYGAPRDLVLGMTVALSDGTLARSGSKVIKNVAGYDLAKLFCGAYGTLGLILSVNLRLHPLAPSTASVIGTSSDPAVLAASGRAMAALPLELEALDVSWRAGRGELLAQCAGAAPEERAEQIAGAMREAGLTRVEITTEDGELWNAQRAAQRSLDGTLVRIAARPNRLERVIEAVRTCGGTLVARVALGASYATLDAEAVTRLRELLPDDIRLILLDAPEALRHSLDPWGALPADSSLELMRRVKARFDPAGACNPGIFVAGI